MISQDLVSIPDRTIIVRLDVRWICSKHTVRCSSI